MSSKSVATLRSLFNKNMDTQKNPNFEAQRRFLPTDAETTKTSFGVLDLEAGGFMIFSKYPTFDI